MMKSNDTLKPKADYFESFSAYLQSGDTDYLAAVFPDADNLSKAAVYRNGFLRSCTEALRASYPVVALLVGKEYFDYLADAYIDLHPPQHSSFATYGGQFPEFIEARLDEHQLAYLGDFAELDKAWLRAYFAQDSELLREKDIEAWQNAGKNIEDLVARLPASAVLLSLQHQVSLPWLALKTDETLPENTQIESMPEHIIVWRDTHDQVSTRKLTPAELAFLAPLQEGATLAHASESALKQNSDFPIIDYFSELLNTDLLATK